MSLQNFRVGNVRITRIPETCAPAVSVASFFPDLSAEQLAQDTSWASPVFYDEVSQKVIFSTHTWLIQTPNYNILFELGAGNAKDRPNFPRAHQLDTAWLENFYATGLAVEDIDFLFPSHLHVDHIGWFTQLVDGQWRPTFPAAKALIVRNEMDNWTPGKRQGSFPTFNEGVIEDCVFPLRDRGMVDYVEFGHQLDDGLHIVSMIGHTRGHAGLHLESLGETAVFCGDLMYSPLQLVHHDLNAYADEDRLASKVTRLKTLQQCADNDSLLFPSHYPEPFSAVKVKRTGGQFSFYKHMG